MWRKACLGTGLLLLLILVARGQNPAMVRHLLTNKLKEMERRQHLSGVVLVARHSNGGYILLGLIIEAVSHQSYDDYVNEHIYIPAGMKHTGAYALDEINKDLATGYIMDPEHPGQWKNNIWQNSNISSGAGKIRQGILRVWL